MYQTPNFSGFQFGVGYSFNTNGGQAWKFDPDVPSGWTTDDLNRRGITAGLRYANGPIAVALSYDQERYKAHNGGVGGPAAATEVNSTTVSAWALAGSYDFEVAKVHLGFGQGRNGVFSAEQFGPADVNAAGNLVGGLGLGMAGAWDGLKFNSYTVGVSAPVGGGTIMASWAMNDPRSLPRTFNDFNDAQAALGTDVRAEMKKQQIYSLGYTYGLSKRTTLYAIGSYAKNASFMSGAKSQLIGLGMTHAF